MSELTVIRNGQEIKLSFAYNPILLELLQEHGFDVPHSCGGNGACHCCVLPVNGRPLPTCQVRAKDGMVVEYIY